MVHFIFSCAIISNGEIIMNYMDKEKHYNPVSRYYKDKFKTKIAKISFNLNFGCPNRDGTKGFGGCTFCSETGSGDFAGNICDSISKQYNDIKGILNKKWPNAKYLAYLQAFSNTYADINTLKNVYYQIISLDKNIVGLAIATRPDCLSEDVIKLLDEINQIIPVQLELGLQTINDETAKKINRGYSLKEFESAMKLLNNHKFDVVVHIINGLPNETKTDMINNIKLLNKYPINGIKIHSLLILNRTKMALEYELKPFKILTLNEYVDIVCDQIGYLRDDIIIHRLAADGNISDLIEPKWTIKKLVVQNEIDKELRKRNIYQGDYLKSSSNNK